MTSSALNVLIVGANGYLGTAIGQAFLRTRPPVSSPPPPTSTTTTTTTAATSPPPPPPPHFRVFGLVRRAAAARTLATQEVVPIIGSLSDDDPTALRDKILSHIAAASNGGEDSNKPVVHVIAICTEPADRAARAKHWTDVLGLVQGLSAANAANDNGAGTQGNTTRPLVLWSSGCKDYGTTGLHGEPGLAPHTEDTPLAPHELVRGRADAAVKALESAEGFDAVVLRATPICGYSGSLYGAGMEHVEGFAAAVGLAGAGEGEGNGKGKTEGKREDNDKVLKFVPPAGTVMHGMHVDDCADAYVAVAVTALFGGEEKRRGVVGQAFNISGRRYETLEEVSKALAKEYGFGGDAEFGVDPAALPEGVDPNGSEIIFGWSQWVDSKKIREATGWSDWRPLFSENVHAYRLAFEAAREGADENVKRIRERMAGNWGKE